MDCSQTEMVFQFQNQGKSSPTTQVKQVEDLSAQEVYVLKEECSWIDQYLYPDVLLQNNQPGMSEEELMLQGAARVENREELRNSINKEENIDNKKNRSIFHNVQKHLITFLRKIHLRRIDLVNKPSGLRAYELWKIFKSSKEYTKKCLYMIFGVEGNHNTSNLLKMAGSLPELSKMIARYPFVEIQNAQAVIRQAVCFEISHTPKGVIQSQCKMAKFQQFYDYLQTFCEQLSASGLSMRIRKQQKEKVLQKRIQTNCEGEHLFTQ